LRSIAIVAAPEKIMAPPPDSRLTVSNALRQRTVSVDTVIAPFPFRSTARVPDTGRVLDISAARQVTRQASALVQAALDATGLDGTAMMKAAMNCGTVGTFVVDTRIAVDAAG